MTLPAPDGGPAVTVVDYGVGNLTSVRHAMETAGAVVRVARTTAQVETAEALLLPGVGSFPAAMDTLRSRGLDAAIVAHVRNGKPLLGVCLGMQLLADESEEQGRHRGLGIIAGRVQRLPATTVQIPHIGWNDVHFEGPGGGMATAIDQGSDFYFVHSYAFVPDDRRVAKGHASHGERFVCAIEDGPIWATQFHPEKSQRAGIQLLANYVALCAQGAGRQRSAS